MRRYLTVFAALMIGAGCATTVYYDRPREWRTVESKDSAIALFAPYLEGRRIFLDPGHGGSDRASIGPGGVAVEADVNLRVSLALRDLLQRAGATVLMSRMNDTTVALKDRPALALRSGAEVFISIHHNATGTKDEVTNYTAVFYHAHEGHPRYHPSNYELARYIQRDLSYAMRNAGPPSSPTFDGTLSDFNIYPDNGFAVLRDNTLPALLVEGSFFTHPHEENRLALDEFNQIQAWGIFVGLGRYFRAGIPQLHLASDTLMSSRADSINVLVSSKQRILGSTLRTTLNDSTVRSLYNDSSRTITVFPDGQLCTGVNHLRVRIKSTNGNTSWPFQSSLLLDTLGGVREIDTLSSSFKDTSK